MVPTSVWGLGSAAGAVPSMWSKIGFLFKVSSASYFFLLGENKAEKTSKLKRSGVNSCEGSHTMLTEMSKNPFSSFLYFNTILKIQK